MRFAALLIVLALALGAFLVLRSPSSDSAGIAPDGVVTPVSETAQAPVMLERGDRTPAASLPAAPASSRTQQQPDVQAPDASKQSPPSPTAGDGVMAVSNSVEASLDSPELAKKYAGTTPDERRQAIEAIRNLTANSANVEPKLFTALKHEMEWLERSLEG